MTLEGRPETTFVVAPAEALAPLTNRLVEIRIDDPAHRLGSCPELVVTLADPRRAQPPRHVHVDDRGCGRLVFHLPAEAIAITLVADHDARDDGRSPQTRVLAPNPARLALAAGFARPRALLRVLRLLLARNRRGAEIRFLRLVEAMGVPDHRRWSALRAAEDAATRPALIAERDGWAAPPGISVVIEAGPPAAGATTRADLATQIHPPFEVIDAPARPNGAIELRLPAGTRLSPGALFHLVRPFVFAPETIAVYCDEDTIDDRRRHRDPRFHSAWNRALAEAGAMAPTALAIRRDALPDAPPDATAVERLLAAGRDDRIAHVPRLLVHRPARAPRTEPQPRPPPRLPDDLRPSISVVIPTRDRADLLEACIVGLLKRTHGVDLDVILVDNGSVEPATAALYCRLEGEPSIRRIERPGPFDFPALLADGVALARHDRLLLLNNDIEPIAPHWLRSMAAELEDPSVGAVGARLLFPDGSVQHGGVTLGAGGIARHSFHFVRPDDGEDGGLLHRRRDVSAVTAACLLTRRSIWSSVGGMEAGALAIAWNDVDFCLRIRSRGLRVIWTPEATLLHRESATRGHAETTSSRDRRAAEEAVMTKRWGKTLADDPFHNPNLSLSAETSVAATRPRDRAARFVP